MTRPKYRKDKPHKCRHSWRYMPLLVDRPPDWSNAQRTCIHCKTREFLTVQLTELHAHTGAMPIVVDEPREFYRSEP